jgi:hypothetical protein
LKTGLFAKFVSYKSQKGTSRQWKIPYIHYGDGGLIVRPPTAVFEVSIALFDDVASYLAGVSLDTPPNSL